MCRLLGPRLATSSATIAVFVVMLAMAPTARAATITVNTLADGSIRKPSRISRAAPRSTEFQSLTAPIRMEIR